MQVFQVLVLENLQLLVVNVCIVSGFQGVAVMLFTFLHWLRCEILLIKLPETGGYSDLERDNKSSQLIEESHYLFMYYKQALFTQGLLNFV